MVLPVSTVADLLVSKKVAPEQDTAKKIIFKALRKKVQSITFEEYNKIFCKCIFKEALIELVSSLEQMEGVTEEMPLALKLGIF